MAMMERSLTIWLCLVVLTVICVPRANAADTVTSATVSSSTVVDKTPPTANSPSIVVNNSDICQVGSSGALQTSLFGISGGTTSIDFNCERIKLARSVYGMGLKVAGISLLCQDVRVFDSLWMAGTPCPFLGKIGDAAKKKWLDNPNMSPEGSMIILQLAARAKVKRQNVVGDLSPAEEEEDLEQYGGD